MERRGLTYLLLLPLGALILLFLVWPLALVLWESLWVDGRLSLGNYSLLIFRNLYRESLATSLILSLSTAFLGTLLGVPVSYAIHKTRGGVRSFSLALTAVPLTFSGLIVGFSFIILLGTSGFFTLLMQRFFGINPLEFSEFLFTWRGLVVAYLYFLIPRMILTMVAAWSNADWSQVEAASSLGARPATVFFKVLLPMLAPSVLAGSSLLFAVSMGAFGTAFALTGTGVKILPLVIYTHVSEVAADINAADALAIILTTVTTGVILVYEQIFVARQPVRG
ncbi:MAG: ABC transporter permease subunit [Synergistales bacterium]|nr:ABC transporter permease subunit [Synergistales bacterium]